MKPLAFAVALAGGAPQASPPPAASWSFEAGLPARFSVRVRSAVGYAAEPEFDEHDGRASIVDGGYASAHALSVEVPARGRLVLHTPLVAESGRCTLSTYLRATPPGPVTLRLFESEKTGGTAWGARSRELGARSVNAGAEWSRASLSADCTGGVYGEIEAAGVRAIFVDAIAIDAGAVPSAMPAPVEVGCLIAPGAAGTAQLFAPGETVTISAPLSRPLRPGERVTIEVRNARERPVRVVRSAVEPLVFRVAPRLLGPYRARVLLVDGARTVAWAERAFVVLPPPPAAAAADSLLGTHTRLDARHLAIARRLGFRWLRLHDASMVGQWITVEPEPEAQRYYDAQIDRARAAGFRLLGVLEATPRWASSAPAEAGFYEARAFPPLKLDAWERYVGQAVSHYLGRVDQWEVWNEPYLDEFWRGTPVEYGALAAAAIRAAALAGGPASEELRLFVSAASEHRWLAWSRAALAEAASRGTRAGGPIGVAAHLYDSRLVDAAPSMSLAERVGALRVLTAGARWWMTEGSVLGASASFLPPSAPLAAVDVERAAEGAIAWLGDLVALGAERVFVYQLVESQWESDADFSLLDSDGTPRPTACALATFANLVDGRRPLRAVSSSGVRVQGFGGDARAQVALVAAEGDARFEVRGAAKNWRDVWGNPLLAGEARRVALYQPASGAIDARALLEQVRLRP